MSSFYVLSLLYLENRKKQARGVEIGKKGQILPVTFIQKVRYPDKLRPFLAAPTRKPRSVLPG
jgi:hypothetical protein